MQSSSNFAFYHKDAKIALSPQRYYFKILDFSRFYRFLKTHTNLKPKNLLLPALLQPHCTVAAKYQWQFAFDSRRRLPHKLYSLNWQIRKYWIYGAIKPLDTRARSTVAKATTVPTVSIIYYSMRAAWFQYYMISSCISWISDSLLAEPVGVLLGHCSHTLPPMYKPTQTSAFQYSQSAKFSRSINNRLNSLQYASLLS